MARPLRLDGPGLTHHITNRGNERKKIFRDDADCRNAQPTTVGLTRPDPSPSPSGTGDSARRSGYLAPIVQGKPSTPASSP